MRVSSFLLRYAAVVFLSMSLNYLTLDPAVAAPSGPPAPDREFRSLISGVDAGTLRPATEAAKISHAEALSRGRQAALQKVRNRLIEAKNAGLDSDLSRTSPTVNILSQKTEGGKEAASRLWIETETAFVLKDPRTGGRPDAGLIDRADFLDVRIWTDRKEYREGETVTLHLQGNRDFYGKVVINDVKGKIRQLLPNNYRQISVFEKDKNYRLPDEGDRYQLDVQRPFGVIRFIVYATRLPMSHVNLKTISGGIYEYPSSQKAFGRSVRHVIPAGEEKMTEFCEAVWEIKTAPRTGGR